MDVPLAQNAFIPGDQTSSSKILPLFIYCSHRSQLAGRKPPFSAPITLAEILLYCPRIIWCFYLKINERVFHLPKKRYFFVGNVKIQYFGKSFIFLNQFLPFYKAKLNHSFQTNFGDSGHILLWPYSWFSSYHPINRALYLLSKGN